MNISSERVQSLPPYIFSRINKRKKELIQNGMDVIDLGIGAPDLPTPQFIIDELVKEANIPSNHRYSPYGGCQEFREAVADYYQSRYGVNLDPDKEVLALIGSKEGIANLISAVLNPSDTVMVPDPGYPVYESAIHLSGGTSTYLPLDSSKHFQPNFDAVTHDVYNKIKLMLLNYPNNPTAGTVDLDVFEKAVSLANKHSFAIAQDAAYDLMTFGGYEAPSLLQVPGAKEVGVEFGSLSKSFNMTGWRIGYVVGNEAIIEALSVVKSNTDTSQFLPIQKAAARALRSDLSSVLKNNAVYEERLDHVITALNEMGIQVEKPRGTFYVWANVPDGWSSMDFSSELLEKVGVIVTPGNVFGSRGEGYFRISLSVPHERLTEAVSRMKQFVSQD
ncbi:LL-diaminopimelate aminotransferase [Piscibacillus sp. B03]|uniref:LL-diaminopimelate aminotransferase n=1 Tax=Piscibacillus sp. B03 TaxID=3457430 RepID=UPI003FCD82E4